MTVNFSPFTWSFSSYVFFVLKEETNIMTGSRIRVSRNLRKLLPNSNALFLVRKFKIMLVQFFSRI